MTGLTKALAEFIYAKTVHDLPHAALDKAKKTIADTFAVILAGAGSEVAPPLLRYVEQTGESGASPILGSGRTASPEMAALVNGTFGHALDFDDVLSIMPAHPSAVILPALLANPREGKLPGSVVIEAYAIGLEVGGKIGLAITVGHYHRGFHGTGTLAIFSAVGALAKRYHLDVATTRTAFGIASSMASGLQRNFGTMTKPLHTGWASRSALAAVNLARSGFTAALDVLEAVAGFFAAYGVEASRPEAAIDWLGNPWVIVDPGLALKRFPCCYASHRGMDGVLQLRHRLRFNAEDIERLECRMPPGGMRVLIYPHPKTGLEGKFSLQYALVAGVLDGQYTLWSFTDEAVKRPQIRNLLARICVSEDPCCADNDLLLETRSSGSRGFVEVEAVLRDGRRETVRVDQAPGHPSRELTWEDIWPSSWIARRRCVSNWARRSGRSASCSGSRPAQISARSWRCCTDVVWVRREERTARDGQRRWKRTEVVKALPEPAEHKTRGGDEPYLCSPDDSIAAASGSVNHPNLLQLSH